MAGFTYKLASVTFTAPAYCAVCPCFSDEKDMCRVAYREVDYRTSIPRWCPLKIQTFEVDDNVNGHIRVREV